MIPQRKGKPNGGIKTCIGPWICQFCTSMNHILGNISKCGMSFVCILRYLPRGLTSYDVQSFLKIELNRLANSFINVHIVESVEWVSSIVYVPIPSSNQWIIIWTPPRHKIITIYHTSNRRLPIENGQWSTIPISRDINIMPLLL